MGKRNEQKAIKICQTLINNKETLVTRLYTPRQINFEKTYLFENNEKSQKEEPLSIEYKIPNTIENNLDLPLPQGKIQLYQVLNSGNIEYIYKYG